MKTERATRSRKGDAFEVTIWPGPNDTRGLRIGERNRERFFNPAVRTIVLHLDGVRCVTRLTDGFWSRCPEIRVAKDDAGRNFLAEWIRKHGLQPPGIARRLRGRPDLVVLKVLDPENEFTVSVKKTG